MSRPLCSPEPEVRSSCYDQRSSRWREDAGETPAVQEGTLHHCVEHTVHLFRKSLNLLR
jgi:hypothetical protein